MQPINLLPFVCAYTVNRHHGILIDLGDAFSQDRISYELNLIRENPLPEEIWSFKFTQGDITVNFGNYKDKFLNTEANKILREFHKFASVLRQNAELKDPRLPLYDLYFALFLLISVLTEADHASIIKTQKQKELRGIDPKLVKEFAFGCPRASKSFQDLRERAWDEIENFSQEKTRVFSLTLPTGLGKTLMGAYLAGTLGRGSGPTIYVPYLSIIEQTTNTMRSVFTPSFRVLQQPQLS